MAELVVLGSGTSTGVPVLGVAYPQSFLANSKNHRLRPSVLFIGPGGKVLVDCTPDMRTQLLRENVQDLEAVIVTHTHADHIMGMDDLRAYCLKAKRSMPVYSLAIHQKSIHNVFGYAFQSFPEGIEVPRFDLRDLPLELELAGLNFKFGTVWHGEMPVTGIRVGNLAYVTDVKLVPEESEWLLVGLETLILDCVRLKPHQNHLNLEEAMALIERFKPKQTYLTHLSHDFEEGATELPEGVALAWDGLRIEFEG